MSELCSLRPELKPEGWHIYFLYITTGFQNKPTMITSITVGFFSSLSVSWNRRWCLYILKKSFVYWINGSICIPMSKWLEFFLASVYTQIKIPHRILGFSNHFFINYIFLCADETKVGEFHLRPNRFFSSTSTKFLSLGHIRACVKVWHHSRSFRG